MKRKIIEKSGDGLDFYNAVKLSKRSAEDVYREMGISSATLYNYFNMAILDPSIKAAAAKALGRPVAEIFTNSIESSPNKVTGADLRLSKALNGRTQKGILAVPIKAQAGYARMLHDDFAVFMDQLDRVIIPDFPYDGDDFRMFQVEGDSMEYVNENGRVAGLQNGIWVVGQLVPQEDWRENLSLYRVHVIVMARQCLIKRVLQDNPDEIILHSDNEEMHPQERIKLADVKEIWYVVRKLDWDMPPPRRIEIRA